MAATSWTIDRSRMPLVITTFGKRFHDDDDVRALLAAADALFASRQRFVHVIDTRPIESPANAVQRKILGDWFRGVRETNANAGVVATAIVVNSTIVRGAITAVLWLTSSATEKTEAFSDLDSALRWLQGLSRETGVDVGRGAASP